MDTVLTKVAAAAALALALSGCASDTRESAERHIPRYFAQAGQHDGAMRMILEILETADRNFAAIDSIARYAAFEGSGTQVYVDLASDAARAPYAPGKDFVRLAKRFARTGSGPGADLIRAAASALADAQDNQAYRAARAAYPEAF